MSQNPTKSSSDAPVSITRKVTIYRGTTKYEASLVNIFRGPDLPYEDAFHFEFKPKGARNLRAFKEYANPKTVVVDGWGHPEFDELLRALREAPSIETAPGVSVQTVSFTYRPGAPSAKNKYELELEEYLKNLDPSRILVDTRGAIVKKR